MISILIPIHNEEEMLEKYLTRFYPAVDYITRQFNTPVEVVLIDDGSTDASWGMIKYLADSRSGYYRRLSQEEPGNGCCPEIRYQCFSRRTAGVP